MINHKAVAAIAIAVSLVLASAPDTATGAEKEFSVIVHKNNPVTELGPRDIQKFFLGKQTFWEWGKQIQTCDLIEPGRDEEKTSRAMFSLKFLNKKLTTLKSYWIKMIFSGRGQPPISFQEPGSVLKFVAENEGAICYVPSESVTDSVKAVRIMVQEKK